jgi:uncharacterized surface protein with fasciclin (FAS1) repeats
MRLKTLLLTYCLVFGLCASAVSQNYGQLTATDAVTGSDRTLTSLVAEKGIVLIFHDTSCPFANLYEERIKILRDKFQSQGIAFVLVNPQASNSAADQSRLRGYMEESGLNMPYLIDEKQAWTKLLNVTKIPEVMVLVPGKEALERVYMGAIDNNAQAENAVTEKYLDRALNQLLLGEKPSPAQARAVGCNIRSY